MGVVVRRYIYFLILLMPTLVSVLFCSSIPTFCSFFIYSAGRQESRKCIFSLNVHFLSDTSCY